MNVPRSFVLLAASLIVVFLAGLWSQRNVGLADNSDFTRSIYTFTSQPVGLPAGWPAYDSDMGQKRFFRYWLPRWELQWLAARPITSAVLLWTPGVLAAAVGVDGGKLDLRVISLFPKLLLLGQLLILMVWAWRQPAHRLTLLLALGVPAVGVFTTTDYLAYLQSFYQESASLVLVLPVLLSLVYYRRHPSRGRLTIMLTCVALLTTAKRSNFYWPLLALPFVMFTWLAAHPEFRAWRRWAAVACGLFGTVAFTLISLRATRVDASPTNPYDSFFDGALTFSRDPAAHLQRFGLQGAAGCVGQAAFSPVGQRFLADHSKETTFRYAFLTYLGEPRTLWAALGHVFRNMQDVSLEYLGKYALEDPRARLSMTQDWPSSSEVRAWNPVTEGGSWNAWAALKFRCFPTGAALALCLAAFAGWFAWGLRGPEGTPRELAAVGLMATLACGIDMLVAIVGDGRFELIKHLFLANLLFDIAAVVFLGSVAVWVERRFSLGQPAKPVG